ncbi:MAG TPA: bifunctional ADP-heptose synthase [Bacillota bacterium]|jgi:rfaE bifunctional protein kinase chain/domain|nr:bifunctional ADP-heptose synthase [Bacillota bacterium]HOL08708.1 bifunctional ADP-heptose synthase [Bacillota bacterium]HPO96389.1 bifunctional ADP-heptose synthase [Bacillota bacterium]
MLNFLEKFKQQNVLVFGDIIADTYEFGMIKRMSREAPIPIVEFQSEKTVPGGAGNVLYNLKSLSANPIPVSVIGTDSNGQNLLDCFKIKAIETDGIITTETVHTTTKRRILAQGEHTVRQQILRLDRLPDKALDDNVLSQLWDIYIQKIESVQAIIISDYHLPAFPENFLIKVANYAVQKGKLVVVDSRHRLLKFKNVSLVTPNLAETEEALGKELKNEDDLKNAAISIQNQINSRLVLITLGDQGMALLDWNQNFEIIPVFSKQEVFDVSGAGDTVVAAITLGIISGMQPIEAAKFSNIAAGIVVRKLGTATVSLEEIKPLI